MCLGVTHLVSCQGSVIRWGLLHKRSPPNGEPSGREVPVKLVAAASAAGRSTGVVAVEEVSELFQRAPEPLKEDFVDLRVARHGRRRLVIT